MRVFEVTQLIETVDEISDLQTAAKFVSNFVAKYGKKLNPSDPDEDDEDFFTYSPPSYSLLAMSSTLGIPRIKFKTETVNKLLNDVNPLDFYFNLPILKNVYGMFFKNSNAIGINVNNIKQDKKDLQSTLVHELQHALDNFKSKNTLFDKGFETPTPGDEKSMNRYYKQQHEVNARFSQMLYTLAKEYLTVGRKESTELINDLFIEFRLYEDLIGTKAYKRLLSRTYKFIDEMNILQQQTTQAPKDKQPKLADKIKELIKKWANPK